MDLIVLVLVGTIYGLATLGLLIYGLNCYVMLALCFRKRRLPPMATSTQPGVALDPADCPFVTTQIAVYNELNVVERVIRTVAKIRYPAGRHEIQVLDDSTDETCALVDRLVAEYRAIGVDIQAIRRAARTGFKGGALQHGLQCARGELIAIFDADFLPSEDFLERTVPFFRGSPKLGFLQTRWGHVNRSRSLLTRVQALGIDGHFMVEQTARCWGNLFMNFNGTCGIWRKSAIEREGGWQWDTLTEDLDLSYRVQLAGWSGMYLPQIVVPGELPEDVKALRSQQFRWAKGSFQTLMKLFPQLMRARVSPFKKMEALLHMGGYCVHPLMLIMAVMALPFMLVFSHHTIPVWLGALLSIPLVLSLLGPSTMYVAGQLTQTPRNWRALRDLPLLMVVGVGFALSNTRAIVEALIGRHSDFLRTPKRGNRELKQYRVSFPVFALFEIGIGVYCALACVKLINMEQFSVSPFVALYAAGFLFVGLITVLHSIGLPDKKLFAESDLRKLPTFNFQLSTPNVESELKVES